MTDSRKIDDQGSICLSIVCYYKELAQRIMENNKSPNLHSASWKLRAADIVVPPGRPACSRPMKANISVLD